MIACFACSSAAPVEPPVGQRIDVAVERAGAFLGARQSEDGGFRSKTYAALRDGWSVTPLAALALRVTPASQTYARAVAFVARTGEAQPSYPLYAWALGALVLSAPENVERHRAARDALLVKVRAMQLGGSNGWKLDDASFGGWGYSPRIPARPAGEVKDDMLTSNLSATVLAVGALALAGAKPDDPALRDAARFVENCRATDGGFFFSPALPVSNKAGGFRAYGSMTADGLRASLRLGMTIDAPLAWLTKHFEATRNPGEFAPVDEVRRQSSYYYYAWSISHAFAHAKPDDKAWAEELAAELLARQLPDGSWRNPASEMREDDPLVATSFAVAALALCRGVITGDRVSHAAWK